jgi:hypothetical protein
MAAADPRMMAQLMRATMASEDTTCGMDEASATRALGPGSCVLEELSTVSGLHVRPRGNDDVSCRLGALASRLRPAGPRAPP